MFSLSQTVANQKNQIYSFLMLSLSAAATVGHGRGLEPPPAANVPAPSTAPETPVETPQPAQPVWTEEQKPAEAPASEPAVAPVEAPADQPAEEAKEPPSDEPLTDFALYVSTGFHRVLANQMGGTLQTGGATNVALAWKLREDDGSTLFGMVRYEPLSITGRISDVEVRGALNQYYFGVEQKRSMFELNLNHSLEVGISSSSIRSVDFAQETPAKAKKSSLLLAYEAGLESYISGKRLSVGASGRLSFLQTQNFSINLSAKWYL